MEQGKKYKVIDRPEYDIYLEVYNKDLFAHSAVFSWSKYIKKQFIKDWKGVLDSVSLPIFVVVSKDNPKLIKFLSIVGFEYFQDAGDETHHLYVATSGERHG